MGMSKPGLETTIVAFRLPVDLVARIDEHAKRMEAERPGVSVTRTDAVRAIIHKALRVSEGKKVRR